MKYKSLLYCVAGSLLFAAIGSQALDQNITRDVYGLSEMVDKKNKTVDTATKIPNAINVFMCLPVTQKPAHTATRKLIVFLAPRLDP